MTRPPASQYFPCYWCLHKSLSADVSMPVGVHHPVLVVVGISGSNFVESGRYRPGLSDASFLIDQPLCTYCEACKMGFDRRLIVVSRLRVSRSITVLASCVVVPCV